MLIRLNQRGEGKLGCIVGLLILASACFAAYKLIPVKVKAAEMRDAIEDEARSAGGRSNATIMKAILIKAGELQLPITEKNVKISRRSEYIIIECEYTVPVEFPGYTFNWTFNFKKENPVF